MVVNSPLSFDAVLSTLKAAGEETRLRIVALLAEGELSVSDLIDILGQSQPRISRHLKLLMDAGLAARNREGAFAFFRLETRGAGVPLAQALAAALDREDPVLAGDRARLLSVRASRAKSAEQYFSRHAIEWDRIRSLHVAESEVEQAVLAAVGEKPVHALLDLGAGTGRMLQLFAKSGARLVGVDSSPAMLQVARANLAKAGVRGVELRQGDIYALPVERNAFDLVVIHQVLHFLDDPARALREAAAALAPGGRMIVVDFAPHGIEDLREKQSHRRLGFTPDEITQAMREAGLDVETHRDLPPPDGEGVKLTVSIWTARDRRVITDFPLQHSGREVA